MHDVIVVGAGPAGLYAAKLLKEKGLDILVIEEHENIGEPNHCSGLVSTNLEKLVPVEDDFLEHTVSGAVMHTPAGDIKLQKPGIAAYVINRPVFDRSLAKGLEPLITHARCKSVTIERGCAVVRTDKGDLKSRLVLGCDGPGSVVAKAIGTGPREMLKGVIAIENTKDTSENVELWFDKKAAPDGFLWKIPRGGRTEYGMMSTMAGFERLTSFFKNDFNAPGIEKFGGFVPIGPRRTYSDRVMIVGDAAAHVKPWSGGGVIYGLTAAVIAAEIAGRAIEKNDFSADLLSEYEKRWRDEIGKGITLGLMFREFYKQADEETLKDFFSEMKSGKANELDMDLLGF